MATASWVPSEGYLLHLLGRAERARGDGSRGPLPRASSELRALELWRGVIGECLSTLVFVFLCCGAHVSWGPLHSVNTLSKSFSTGFAAATAHHALPGAHANPALTLAALSARRITPLRALFYSAAQCGGAVAGAALLYGVTSTGAGPCLGCTLVGPAMGPWQAAALECVLTFVVGLVFFASLDPDRKSRGSDAIAIGLAYLACSLVAIPATGASMNPARSLGPAFVMNNWTHHWVYWLGPVSGAVLSGLIYEYIFETPRSRAIVLKEDSDRDPVDDTDSKSSSGLPQVVRPIQIHQAPCFRGPTPEGAPRPPRSSSSSRGPQPPAVQSAAKYSQTGPTTMTTAYYSSLPRGGAAYRTWSSEYGSSQQFKF